MVVKMKNIQQQTLKPLFWAMIIVVMMFSLLQTQVSYGAAYTIRYDPKIAALIAQVNKQKLFAYVNRLSGKTAVTIGGSSYFIRTRNSLTGVPIQKATQYVYETLLGMPGLDSVRYAPWKLVVSSNRNVVGVLTGTTRPREIILLTAHLDDMPAGRAAPGADDNASGAAALMMAASLLSQHNFERTIRFVFFTGEEQGLYGSYFYAQAARKAGENIVAVVNMDMLGWESDGKPVMRVHTRPAATGAKDLVIANQFVNVVKTYAIDLTPIVTSYGMSWSDHGSFWSEGFPAVCLMEDDDDSNPNGHTTADTVEKLNFPYFTRIVAATVGSIAHLAFLNDQPPVITATATRTPTRTAVAPRTATMTPALTRTSTPRKTAWAATATRTPTRTSGPKKTP